ncbi:hypothetical protein CVT26_016112 [Gymnopilus dilepis]|uniref:Uncharacterized protein n=1 Tax=Gymnopilus dilepis TaxID=231916 RepID=A0A409XYX2_9AGAR|nr:hypothetical protein CVT26_016112 [Gymnopilus dilepis]
MAPDLERSSELLQKKGEYEAERDALLLQVAQVEYKIQKVQAEYGASLNREVPILRLPNEVTCMIFEYAPDSYTQPPETSEGPSSKYLFPEVVVSHVCYQWRSIALELPQLWTSFSYDASLIASVPLDRLDVYLERSKSHQLNLWFGLQDVEDTGGTSEILDKALSHIGRWRSFTFSAGPSSTPQPTIQLLERLQTAVAPRLKHLSLNIANADLFGEYLTQVASGISHLSGTVFVEGVPEVHSLTVQNFLYRPPLSHITTLRIENQFAISRDVLLTWSALRDILSRLSLINLSLGGYIFDGPTLDLFAEAPILMNDLKHLRLGLDAHLSFVLTLIRAPVLQTLVLHGFTLPPDGYSLPSEDDPDAYVFPALKSVSFTALSCANSARAALYFARMAGSATDICIRQDGEYDEGIFEVLLNDLDLNQRYWTTLKHLTLGHCVAEDLEDIVRFAFEHSTTNLVVHVARDTFVTWQGYDTEIVSIEALKKVCTIDVMNSLRHPLWSGIWPPEGPSYIDRLSDGDIFQGVALPP